MNKDHPKVKFGKTGIMLLILEHQIQQAGGISENILKSFYRTEG